MECQPLGPYDRWLDASKERFTMALVADAAKVFARLPASGRGHPGRPDGWPLPGGPTTTPAPDLGPSGLPFPAPPHPRPVLPPRPLPYSPCGQSRPVTS